MRGKDCHIVLSTWNDHAPHQESFQRVAKRISEIDGGVGAHVVSYRRSAQWSLVPLWMQPTLSLVMREVPSRKLLPGRFMTGRDLGKMGEYERMDAAGIPVPKWTVIGPDTRLDPEEWGPYVVEKPSRGLRGAFVRIRKTARLRYTPPESLPSDHPGGTLLAQAFIYTGEWPTSYRVVTLFGEVLVCIRQATATRGPPLRGRWRFKETGGISIVSNSMDMQVEMVADPDVIALAERAHRAAFGDVALLNFDIVRDAETGALFVLESHPYGFGWMFSNPSGLGIQATHGISFERQFDGIDKAARIFAAMTRKLALRRSPFGAEDPPVWWADDAGAAGGL